MTKYLRKFETMASYNEAKSNLILPNVSLITETNGVAYKPSTPSHDYVEIAGIKWATMNVGANSITDTGLYFQWGDTQGYIAAQVGEGEGQKYFDWEDYKYAELDPSSSNGSGSGSGSGGSTYKMTKYNETDGKTVLDASDDAVTAAWGGQWRMPTTAEFQALGAAVNTAWTQVNNVYGILCTDKTDSSKTLFFPAAGICNNGSVDIVGTLGSYWSSSLDQLRAKDATIMRFVSWEVDWRSYYSNRFSGHPVRGILDE